MAGLKGMPAPFSPARTVDELFARYRVNRMPGDEPMAVRRATRKERRQSAIEIRRRAERRQGRDHGEA